jgi:glycosyltransferase involved in cell wall biosynthesis
MRTQNPLGDAPRREPPLVSVIVPARNAAAFLPDAIASVQAQTISNIEILVVDDASSDGTWPLLLKAAALDARVRPIRRPARGGAGAARNAAIRRAQGRWIALLDADDLWLPQRLERLVPLAEEFQADLLADDLLLRDFETGEDLGVLFGPGASDGNALGLSDLLARDMPDAPEDAPGAIGYAQPLIRRDFLSRHRIGYDTNLSASEDLVFLFACVAAGAHFRLVDEALYVYRLRRASVSRRPGVAQAQADANRRMTRIAAAARQGGAMALLERRQRLLDSALVADAAASGNWLHALSRARWADPRSLATDLRVVAGAARRRIAPDAEA